MRSNIKVTTISVTKLNFLFKKNQKTKKPPQICYKSQIQYCPVYKRKHVSQTDTKGGKKWYEQRYIGKCMCVRERQEKEDEWELGK